ncbi:hypothetical protein SmB9_15280 [Sphingosinicella microcystinivorans]|uniref:Uncharacterized protein n=1 Tax=Sphingosinicella microcystinivorans TaxID=335406 RepID=A0AAD1D5D4_SPHMI|nr:hypothetical protein SmB9_15280 [Sphingosinicella microcystinivorans]
MLEVLRVHRGERGGVNLLHGACMTARIGEQIIVCFTEDGDPRAEANQRFGLEIENGHARDSIADMVKRS